MQYMNILHQTKLHSAFEALQLQTFRALLAPLSQRRYWMTEYSEGWFEVFWQEKNNHIVRELWLA